jgi:hypothetical protein
LKKAEFFMNKVKPGQSFEVKAETWNAFIDAAIFTKNQSNSGNAGSRSGVGGGVVLVRNEESSDFPQFGAIALTDMPIKPSSTENIQEFKCRPPLFFGRRVTAAYESYPYAITLEPIPALSVGRALVLGVTPAQVRIVDSTHAFAVPDASVIGGLTTAASGVARILWKYGSSGMQWAMLQLGGAGSGGGNADVVLCLVSGGSAETGFTVTLYGNGKDQASTGTGKLYAAELAINSAIPSGSWIIGHRAMLVETGGNES